VIRSPAAAAAAVTVSAAASDEIGLGDEATAAADFDDSGPGEWRLWDEWEYLTVAAELSERDCGEFPKAASIHRELLRRSKRGSFSRRGLTVKEVSQKTRNMRNQLNEAVTRMLDGTYDNLRCTCKFVKRRVLLDLALRAWPEQARRLHRLAR
jgi:hypothetical protein